MTTCLLLRCLQHPQPVQEVVFTPSLVSLDRATLHSFHSTETLFSRPLPDTLQLPSRLPSAAPRGSCGEQLVICPKLKWPGVGVGEGWAVARVLRGAPGKMKSWSEAEVEEDVHEGHGEQQPHRRGACPWAGGPFLLSRGPCPWRCALHSFRLRFLARFPASQGCGWPRALV